VDVASRLHPPRPGRRWLPWTIAAVVGLGLFVAIDDPSRDFTEYHAAISDVARDPRLRPRFYPLAPVDLERAIRGAAQRLRNWEFVGTASLDGSTRLVFERTSRVFHLKDDVVLRVEAEGQGSRLTGESRSRLEWGDLGQNPRNLRRILDELDTVLASYR
jgi:hypothetical protein